jgi:hypothetical protein
MHGSQWLCAVARQSWLKGWFNLKLVEAGFMQSSAQVSSADGTSVKIAVWHTLRLLLQRLWL